MNSNTIKPLKRERQTSPGAALVKGAMLWGPAYAAGASAVAHWLAPETSAYTETFLSALMFLAPCGALGELLRWKLLNRKPKRTVRRNKRGRRSFPKHQHTRLLPRHA